MHTIKTTILCDSDHSELACTNVYIINLFYKLYIYKLSLTTKNYFVTALTELTTDDFVHLYTLDVAPSSKIQCELEFCPKEVRILLLYLFDIKAQAL